MALETLVSLCYFVLYALYDFAIYVLVDLLVKSSLHGARDDEEKRLIWLFEAGFLFLVSLLIGVLHHRPYTLLVLAAFTFLYTQIQGRINFSHWWHRLYTHWEEFQQHEESMGHLLEMQTRQAQNPAYVQVPQVSTPASAGWLPPPPANFPMPQQMSLGPPPSVEPWYAEKTAPGPRMPNSFPIGPQLRFRNVVAPNIPLTSAAYSNPPAPVYSTPTMTSPMPVRYAPFLPRGAHLARRPLHPVDRTPESPNISSRIKSSVMSVLGFTLPHNPMPGLKNQGQNICFLNSVLQCLAHSPCLVKSLGLDSRVMRESGQDVPLVEVLSELLEQLAATAGNEKYGAFDTDALRAACATQPGSLVLDPRSADHQTQQDAAEFLMWLLDALHTTLNCKRPVVPINPALPGQGPPVAERHPFCPHFTVMTLKMLKFIYGDLTPPRVQELKMTCRTEIESANGLDSDSYAEPIQRLSDLEWLTYKEHNNSAIDDLFTGQLVEAQHCIACNRISVSIQTFNVLPVPIVEPRQLNGIVYLEDCFAKFGNIEDLIGLDGLCCDSCNQLQTSQRGDPRTSDTALGGSPALRNGGATRNVLNLQQAHSPSDSGLQATFSHNAIMSPIPTTGDPINDSAFQDHQFRTSTPIRGTTASVRLTDGQRRSLLRQLPECLIVQLMRFSYHQGQPRKLGKPVSIPLVKLDLTPLIIDNVMKREDLTALNSCFRYDLCGLCMHLGSDSTNCGHYVAYSQTSDGHWYKFDDEVVSQVNMEYELSTRQVRENAYLLFYRKSTLV